MAQKTSFPRNRVKILLLEGIHPLAVDYFERAGYRVELLSHALEGEELQRQIEDTHILGIRSKTQIDSAVLEDAKRLLCIGCFCIGTNQVDLSAASSAGVPVFNAPFSNTRSVAELTVAEIVMLARKAAHRSQEMHQGIWNKSAVACYEVRNKTLGIIGYGHIGEQVSLLAESFGMRVVFYDIVKKLPLGNAIQLESIGALFEESDFVTLHVPETDQTKNLIGAPELSQMRQGSYLLNLSRGSVVDVAALAQFLSNGHLAGAAVDVFPHEPASNDERFESELCSLENVILTPHVGGSTIEAQENIGLEVASALVKFTETGSTTGSVNFPQVELPLVQESHRILNMHRNVPGVLSRINSMVSAAGANIMGQYLATQNDVGYLIMDVDETLSQDIKREIDTLDETIRTRLLF